MTVAAIHALLPLLILAGTIAVLLVGIAIRRGHRQTATIAVLGLSGALLSVFASVPGPPELTQPLLVVDGFTRFFWGLVLAAALVTALISYSYLEGRALPPEELYLLLILATLGACTLSAAVHFASLFLGLELLTVSLYTMIAYLRDGEKSVEAGVKYLILAAISSAFLLFGTALLFAETGSMTFASLATFMTRGDPLSPIFLTGVSFMTVGVGFKLALVPFHLWTPDVYEGAPAPVGAFVATASKGAVVAVLLRFAALSNVEEEPRFILAVTLLSAASMIVGNLLALRQHNVKRVLAYSSIAHLGYALVGFVAGGAHGAESVAFYMAAYFVTMLGAFTVVALLSDPNRDAEHLSDFKGLGTRRPVVAAAFTVCLLSLAGIPMTGGFIGKFLILSAGVETAIWPLVLLLVLGSLISLFYYLRIVGVMYFGAIENKSAPDTGRTSLLGGLALALLLVVLFSLGIQPSPLLYIIRVTVGGLF